METNQPAECPLCLARMQLEYRDGVTWLACPNGCPTESVLLPRRPAETEESDPRARLLKATAS